MVALVLPVIYRADDVSRGRSLVGRLGGRLGALVLVGALAAACGSSVSSATGGSGHTKESTGTTATTSATTGSTTTTTATTAACSASALSLSQDPKELPSASGHSATFFAVSNNGPTTCEVSGYPSDVVVFDSGGANLQVKVQNANPGALFLLTAPASAPVVLAPHVAAYFGFAWTDEVIPSSAQSQSETCPEGSKLQLSIAGGTLQSAAALPQLCNSSATVTALASASANWGPSSP